MPDLTDGQWASLFACGSCLIIIPFTWWIDHWQEIGYTKTGGKKHGDSKAYWKMVKVLHFVGLIFHWVLVKPFSQVTVMFHESSHAITALLLNFQVTGMILKSGGAGETQMKVKQDGKFSPTKYKCVLFMGYVGSAFWGCIFIMVGFDTAWSKRGAVAFIALSFSSLALFFLSPIVHVFSHAQRKQAVQVEEGRKQAVQKGDDSHREKSTEEKEQRRKDKWGTFKIMSMTLGYLITLLVIFWYVADSICLRFFFMYIGWHAVLYALWDIVADNVIEEFKTSDCALLADGSKIGKYGWAMISVCLSLVAALATVGFSLYFFPDTLVQQAINGRNTWPVSPNHWGATKVQSALELAANVKGGDVVDMLPTGLPASTTSRIYMSLAG